MSDRSIREWRPGDGLRCRWASKAPREVPCGVPAAVITLHDFKPGPYRANTCRSWVVCQNHIPGVVPAGQIRVQAEKFAREKVLADHWDDYQTQLKEEAERLLEAQMVDVPERIRELIRAGGRDRYSRWYDADDEGSTS